jgi:hypothetical protein
VLKVRGKNILWIGLIAILLSMTFVDIGHAQSPTIYLDPVLSTGYLPGDTFDVNVRIKDADSVYAWEFSVQFPGRQGMLDVVTVIEGDFLASAAGTEGTYLASYRNPFEGIVSASCTLKGDYDGASGDGILATIRFSVLEAGETPLTLYGTKLWGHYMGDTETWPIEHAFVSGYYLGPTADMTSRKGWWWWWWWWFYQRRMFMPGTTGEFKNEIKNTCNASVYTNAPLYVRAKYTFTRTDGTTYSMYGGQNFMSETTYSDVELYANEITEGVFGDWAKYGTSPYLNAIDGSYIEGNAYCQLSDIFGFQDVSLTSNQKIVSVKLQGYTKAESLDNDFDVYVWDSFAWIGSLWGETSWGWKDPRWVTTTVSDTVPSTLTQDGLNAFQILLHYYTPDGSPLGNADVDALKLVVTIQTGGLLGSAYIGIVNVGEKLNLPSAMWTFVDADIGKWTVTVSCEYMYNEPKTGIPQVWHTGKTVWTYTMWVFKPWWHYHHH